MNRGLSLITALLVLAAAFCVSGTVMSKERKDYTQENERYALLEDAFTERARGILEERGYQNSGLTITWTRERRREKLPGRNSSQGNWKPWRG